MTNTSHETTQAPEGVIQQMAVQAALQLDGLRAAGGKERIKRMLKRLPGRSVSANDPIFWPAGMLLLGLVEAGELKAAGAYFDRWIAGGAPVSYTDDALAGYALLRLYEQTNEPRYRSAAEGIVSYMLSAEKDEERSIIYHPEIDRRLIYADSAGMTSLFLSRFALLTQDMDALALAAEQLINFLHHGMDDASGLPYHVYDLNRREQLGIVGWGRAVGWLMMGMAQTVSALQSVFSAPAPDAAASADSLAADAYMSYDLRTTYHELQDGFQKLLAVVRDYLRKDGSFAWQLPALNGPADSSATAMIGYALCIAPLPALSDEPEILSPIRDYLLSVTEDGVVGASLAECIDYGQYRQHFGNYPWGQGAALAFLSTCSAKSPK